MIKRFSVSSYISVAGWFINVIPIHITIIVMYGVLSMHNPWLFPHTNHFVNNCCRCTLNLSALVCEKCQHQKCYDMLSAIVAE